MKLTNLFSEKNTSRAVEILSVLLMFFIAYIVFLNNHPGLKYYYNSDVQKGFERGIDVINGANSYLDFNPKQMLSQEKVPGFFPLYFYFMAVLAWISNYSFVLFIDLLRYVIFFCYLSIGLLLYLKIRKKGKVLALTCMAVFMFNRWTLNDVIFLKQEAYVILLLLLSLLSLKKHKYLSYLLFGIATGLKHLTILISPIYLVDLVGPLLRREAYKYKKVLFSVLIISAPIILSSIPYLTTNTNYFFSSIFFNVTREPESTQTLKTGFDKVLILYNQDKKDNILLYCLPRLPLIAGLLLASYLYISKKLGVWQYGALTYAIFVGFNPSVFNQYFVWFVVFLSLALVYNRVDEDY